jgi:hypothetical protein
VTCRRLAGCRASVGRVLSSVAAGHPGGTRSALDRFRETSIVDRRVRGDVPLTLCPAASVCFLIFPPMKPRLGPLDLHYLSHTAAWGSGCPGPSLSRRRTLTRGAGSPRAGAGKILPRPRRTVGVEKRGDRSHTSGARGGSPALQLCAHQIARFPYGYPRLFRPVRDLSGVSVGCPMKSTTHRVVVHPCGSQRGSQPGAKARVRRVPVSVSPVRRHRRWSTALSG